MSALNYRPDIDGLRTIAVVPVVLFHANVAGFTGGFVGVDIFFVISGFLITTIIHRELGEERFSILRFYERRARRILPALFAVIVASLIAGWFLLVPEDYDKMGQSILSALLFVSNMWFWQNSGGYFSGATDYLPMLHTWSLAVEEQFYIFFPLLLMLLHRIGRRLLLPAIVLLVAGSLVGSVWATPRMPSASFYLLPTRIWELGVGSLLALGLVPAAAPKALREGVGALGLVAVLVPVFVYDGSTVFPGLAALPPVLGAAALIWAGTAGPVLASRLLALRPMVWIGLISYSLYLWHWPIMAFLRNRLFTVELEPMWQVATVLASFVAGWISWRFIERPFRVPVRAGGMGQGRIFALSGAGMAVLGGMTVAVGLTGGAERQRWHAEEIQQLEVLGRNLRANFKCFGARPAEELCVFGEDRDPETETWLLWGDSHALSLLPAMDIFAKNQGVRLILASKGDCAPFIGFWRSDRPREVNQNCQDFLKVIQTLSNNERNLSKIFLSARWPLYLNGRRLKAEGLQKITFSLPAERSRLATPKMFEESLVRLSKELKEHGKEVYIFETVPEIPWHVYNTVRGYLAFGWDLPRAVTAKDMEARQASTQVFLGNVAKNANTFHINLNEAICAPVCRTHEDDVVYYKDHDHLTPIGAEILVLPLLEAYLAEGWISASETEAVRP